MLTVRGHLNTADSEPLEVIDSGMEYDALEAVEDTVDEFNDGCPPMTVPHAFIDSYRKRYSITPVACRPRPSQTSSRWRPIRTVVTRRRRQRPPSRAVKPEVGRLSASTISIVEPTTANQGSGRPSASAAAAVEPKAAKPG